MVTAARIIDAAQENHHLGELVEEIDFAGGGAQVIKLHTDDFAEFTELVKVFLENTPAPDSSDSIAIINTIKHSLGLLRRSLMRNLGVDVGKILFDGPRNAIQEPQDNLRQILRELIADGQVLALVVDDRVVGLQAIEKVYDYHDRDFPDLRGSNVYRLSSLAALRGVLVNGEHFALKRMLCEIVLGEDPEAIFYHLVRLGNDYEGFKDLGWSPFDLMEDDGLAAIVRGVHGDCQKLARDGYRGVSWRKNGPHRIN